MSAEKTLSEAVSHEAHWVTRHMLVTYSSIMAALTTIPGLCSLRP